MVFQHYINGDVLEFQFKLCLTLLKVS